jgi:hypothetical protein
LLASFSTPLLIVRLGEVAGGADDRERARKCAAIPIHFCFGRKASRTFNVRVLLFSKDKQLILDTDAERGVTLPFPARRIQNRTTPLLRDENKVAWLYSMEQLSDGSYLMVASPRPRISISECIS